MAIKNVKQVLRKLGLSTKEVTVYLSLLQLEQGSVQKVANKAEIKRPTTYVILDSLVEKGLAQKGLVGKKTVYITSAPEDVEKLAKEQEKEVEAKKEELREMLPELRALYALAEDRPSIRLFEGKEGLKNLQKEFIGASSEPVMGMNADDIMQDLFPKYEKEIRDIRVEAGIETRHIYTSPKGPYKAKADDKKVLRESRYIPPEKLLLKASFAVHGSLLSLVTFRKKIIGVLIDHQDIADSFKAVFEAAWDAAEKYNK